MRRRLKVHDYMTIELAKKIDNTVDSICEENNLRKQQAPKLFLGKYELVLMVNIAREQQTKNIMFAIQNIIIWCLAFFCGLRLGTIVAGRVWTLRDNDNEYHVLCWKKSGSN